MRKKGIFLKKDTANNAIVAFFKAKQGKNCFLLAATPKKEHACCTSVFERPLSL